MNLCDGITWLVFIFQCDTNLFTGHVKLISVILVEITGQGAERFLGSEGERSSCSSSRHNHFPFFETDFF